MHHVHEEHGYHKIHARCVPRCVTEEYIKIEFGVCFSFTSSVVERRMLVSGVHINNQWDLGGPFHLIKHKRSWITVEALSICKSKKIQCMSVSWKCYSGVQMELSMLNSCHESLQMPTAASCDSSIRLFAGRLLDICCEVWVPWPYPYKAHIRRQELLQLFPWELVDPSSYGCDLAPLDYNFIGPWKQYLGVGWICGNKEVEKPVYELL